MASELFAEADSIEQCGPEKQFAQINSLHIFLEILNLALYILRKTSWK